jgi:cation:H+ antiporter
VSTPVDAVAFVLGAAVSLAASWVLVSRIERMGNRLGVTEAMLGLIAALAADTPEITSAVSALASHQHEIGSSVVVGSNVFNLAALLGLGAVVAGWVALHRRVVVLTGGISLWIAAVCVLVVFGDLPPVVGLLLVVAALGPYVYLAGSRRARRPGSRVGRWLTLAIRQEDLELHPALVPGSKRFDLTVTALALFVVVGASVVMERSAQSLGARFAIPDIVVGGLVLAAVTSLPNAVAAVYLARRGRGTAMLSTALNSNALNVAVGLLLPAAVVGLGTTTSREVLVALWYAGLTAVVLLFAYRDRGLRRSTGMAVLIGYAFFAVVLVVSGLGHGNWLWYLGPPALIGAWTLLLLRAPAHHPPADEPPPLPGDVGAAAS